MTPFKKQIDIKFVRNVNMKVKNNVSNNELKNKLKLIWSKTNDSLEEIMNHVNLFFSKIAT